MNILSFALLVLTMLISVRVGFLFALYLYEEEEEEFIELEVIVKDQIIEDLETRLSRLEKGREENERR